MKLVNRRDGRIRKSILDRPDRFLRPEQEVFDRRCLAQFAVYLGAQRGRSESGGNLPPEEEEPERESTKSMKELASHRLGFLTWDQT